MTPFDSLITLVKDLGISNGYTLSIGKRKVGVVRQLVLTEYDGAPHESLPVERPFVQFLFISDSQRQVKDDAWKAYIELKKVREIRVGDYRIMRINFRQSPYELLNPDAPDEYIRVFNIWFTSV